MSFEKGSDVDRGSWLSLEYFDNTEYDERAPEEWIALGYIEAQRQKEHFGAKGEDVSDLPDFLALEALGLCDEGSWKQCYVVTYDSMKERFGVTFVEGDEEVIWLSKLRVMFVGAESPARHARRVADAVALRRATEAKVRYTTCLDCMPKSGEGRMGGNQVLRIMRRVTGKKRRSGGDQERLEMILDDVNAELTKAVNRMTMLWVFAKARERQTIDEARGDMSIVALKYLTDDVDISGSLRRTTRRTRPTGFGLPWGRPVPGSALVLMPGVEKGFVKNVLSKLTFDTLFTERAVIRTVVGVRALCIDLLKSHPTVQLLPVNLPYKPCSLEAFKEWQKAAIEKTAAKVVDCFTGKVVKMIRGNLEIVGKGWFNIDETSLVRSNMVNVDVDRVLSLGGI